MGLHADNTDDAAQQAYYNRVLNRLRDEGLDKDTCHALGVHVVADCNNVENRQLDYARGRAKTARASRPTP